MVLKVEEAQEKYKEYIDSINELKNYLDENHITVQMVDGFELGGEWNISFNRQNIAKLEWNVPHYLKYDVEYAENPNDSFEIDYIKNLEDWKCFIADIRFSLLNISERLKNTN